jgi:membrane-bound lytic murein transglycosylase MltF
MSEADARAKPPDRLCRRQGQRRQRNPNAISKTEISALAASGRTARTIQNRQLKSAKRPQKNFDKPAPLLL